VAKAAKKQTRKQRSERNKAAYKKVRVPPSYVPRPYNGSRTTYDPEFCALLMDAISGGQTLRGVCREHDFHESTVRKWIREDRGADPSTEPPTPGLSTLYARARELQAEAWADDIVDISDMCHDVQKGKLMSDTRKWLMGKNHIKRFGDKLETTVQGGDKPIRQVTSEMSLKEAADLYQQSLREDEK
jgi:transposase-like protein